MRLFAFLAFFMPAIATAAVAFALAPPAAAMAASALQRGNLRDPVALNIGMVCQWQRECMKNQRRAMTKSLKYVEKYKPPQWRIHLCNKNAARSGRRVDWIGFNQCVRNTSLRPPPPPPPPRKPARKKRR